MIKERGILTTTLEGLKDQMAAITNTIAQLQKHLDEEV